MRRKLFTLASILSLLLCVATVSLWIRSSLISDLFHRCGLKSEGTVWEQEWLQTVRGGIEYRSDIRHGVPQDSWEQTVLKRFAKQFSGPSHDTRSPSDEARGIGPLPFFQWDRSVSKYYDGEQTAISLVIPLWALFLPTAVLPSLWLSKRIRQCRRNKQGRCSTCGYNLTGNTSGVCPECGTPVRQTAKSSAPDDKNVRPA